MKTANISEMLLKYVKKECHNDDEVYSLINNLLYYELDAPSTFRDYYKKSIEQKIEEND